MEEISTSFCFICLLHLANEEGLEIRTHGTSTNQASSDDDDSFSASTTAGEGSLFEKMAAAGMGIQCEDDDAGAEEELAQDAKRVGRLEMLQIVKDPTAGRSA